MADETAQSSGTTVRSGATVVSGTDSTSSSAQPSSSSSGTGATVVNGGTVSDAKTTPSSASSSSSASSGGSTVAGASSISSASSSGLTSSGSAVVSSGGIIVNNQTPVPRNSGIYPSPSYGSDNYPPNKPKEDPIPTPLPALPTFYLSNSTGAFFNKAAVMKIEGTTPGKCQVTLLDGSVFHFAVSPAQMAKELSSTDYAYDSTQNAEADTPAKVVSSASSN